MSKPPINMISIPALSAQAGGYNPPELRADVVKPAEYDCSINLFQELLGHDVVLLPIECGTKRPTIAGWQKVTADKMADPSYLAEFQTGGNIGVLLGKNSNHLCTIDVDSDYDLESFLEMNPLFTNTLQTRGARGGNIWFRMTGKYPKLTPLKRKNGSKFGEFRSDGAQTVIDGIHPDTKKRYELVNKATPITISFESIIWPEDLILPWIKNTHLAVASPHYDDLNSDSALLPDARAYVAKIPPAISGQDGHGQTFAVACALVKGFDLSIENALPILQEYNKLCVPPWSLKELQHKLDNADAAEDDKPRGYLKRFRPYGSDLSSLPNDAGRAARFVDAFGQDIRYVHEWQTWLTWDGNRWRRDRDGGIMRFVKNFCLTEFQKALADYSANPKHSDQACREAAELGDTSQATRMLKMAESDPRVIVHPEKLDADPWLLGTGNGVVELRTGSFRQGRREDYITKTTGCPYDAGARCERFELFLDEIFEGDQELIEFLKNSIGYSLTGIVSEQGFFFLYGCGANGKSRLTETILALLGGYAVTTAPEVIAITNHDTPMHHLAELHGARFVTLPETEEGHRLAESRVKSLTGGDEITACRKYEHPFRFQPQLKLWIHGNHKPEIRGTDGGIWRRVRLIPFNAVFPPDTRDVALQEKLLAELSGVLNLAIAACLKWQRNGLQIPTRVRNATDDYRTEQDVLAEFLEDITKIVEGERVAKSTLYASYERWAKNQGVKNPWSNKAIAKNLRERGIKEEKYNGTRYWSGLRLLQSGGLYLGH